MKPYQIIVLIVCIIVSQAQGQYSEEELKAAYLERFTRFIDWPSTDDYASDTFVIGVLDGEVLENKLESIYATQKIKDRQVEIIKFESLAKPDKLCSCHLLYLSQEWSKALPDISKIISGKPVLLVGEGGCMNAYRYMIAFYKQENRIRFCMDPDLLKESGFIVDYRLLYYASNSNPQ